MYAATPSDQRTSAGRRTAMPLAVGVLAMLSALAGPAWLPGTVLLAGAVAAGVLNPAEPVRAGLLTVVLPAAGAAARAAVDEPAAVGAVLVASAAAGVLALVASHVGAGVQRRRLAPGAR